MSELIGKRAEDYTSELFERVTKLRENVNDSLESIGVWNANVRLFEQKLKAELIEKYGTDRMWEAVPEFQRLIGGSPETGEVDPEARLFICEEIEKFVERMEQKILEMNRSPDT
ncbi:hypothetical protein N9L26_01275 [Candidatus Pacebacteria bacterium]|nr:hypothetical protein [Candidatus Paceibacterota bacterium]